MLYHFRFMVLLPFILFPLKAAAVSIGLEICNPNPFKVYGSRGAIYGPKECREFSDTNYSGGSLTLSTYLMFFYQHPSTKKVVPIPTENPRGTNKDYCYKNTFIKGSRSIDSYQIGNEPCRVGYKRTAATGFIQSYADSNTGGGYVSFDVPMVDRQDLNPNGQFDKVTTKFKDIPVRMDPKIIRAHKKKGFYLDPNNFVFHGKPFNINHVIEAYNTRIRVNRDIGFAGPMEFKDNKGNRYVAGILEDPSGEFFIFEIEKMNDDNLRSMAYIQSPYLFDGTIDSIVPVDIPSPQSNSEEKLLSKMSALLSVELNKYSKRDQWKASKAYSSYSLEEALKIKDPAFQLWLDTLLPLHNSKKQTLRQTWSFYSRDLIFPPSLERLLVCNQQMRRLEKEECDKRIKEYVNLKS